MTASSLGLAAAALIALTSIGSAVAGISVAPSAAPARLAAPRLHSPADHPGAHQHDRFKMTGHGGFRAPDNDRFESERREHHRHEPRIISVGLDIGPYVFAPYNPESASQLVVVPAAPAPANVTIVLASPAGEGAYAPADSYGGGPKIITVGAASHAAGKMPVIIYGTDGAAGY